MSDPDTKKAEPRKSSWVSKEMMAAFTAIITAITTGYVNGSDIDEQKTEQKAARRAYVQKSWESTRTALRKLAGVIDQQAEDIRDLSLYAGWLEQMLTDSVPKSKWRQLVAKNPPPKDPVEVSEIMAEWEKKTAERDKPASPHGYVLVEDQAPPPDEVGDEPVATKPPSSIFDVKVKATRVKAVHKFVDLSLPQDIEEPNEVEIQQVQQQIQMQKAD